MRFEVYPSRKIRAGLRRQWYWRLVGGNGEIVAQSEGYHNRADALTACSKIRAQAKDAPIDQVSK
jgi:uncharacterized protein YegP (UPF0339 family)